MTSYLKLISKFSALSMEQSSQNDFCCCSLIKTVFGRFVPAGTKSLAEKRLTHNENENE